MSEPFLVRRGHNVCMTEAAESEKESWLVLRAQSGDGAAVEELLKSVEQPLYRYILHLVGERARAQDVLQEVFMRIYRKLGWLREPELFRAWAFRIATRETFRQMRKERRWTEQLRDDEALRAIAVPAPTRAEFEPELIERLPQMVAKVSPASRAVIVLYYLQEMSLEEVAAVLEIPQGTVKSRLSYGLESLRRQLKRQAQN